MLLRRDAGRVGHALVMRCALSYALLHVGRWGTRAATSAWCPLETLGASARGLRAALHRCAADSNLVHPAPPARPPPEPMNPRPRAAHSPLLCMHWHAGPPCPESCRAEGRRAKAAVPRAAAQRDGRHTEGRLPHRGTAEGRGAEGRGARALAAAAPRGLPSSPLPSSRLLPSPPPSPPLPSSPPPSPPPRAVYGLRRVYARTAVRCACVAFITHDVPGAMRCISRGIVVRARIVRPKTDV